jgi:hypothetical protein
MSYEILQGLTLSFENYAVVPIRVEDRFAIMEWRNEQLEILRQKEPLTVEDQNRYFHEVVKPDFGNKRPRQILLSFLHQDKLIGYGGLVHIEWRDSRAEVSFLLETSRNSDIEQFKLDYSIFLRLVKRLAFQQLSLHKLTTEAFDLRPYLIDTLEASGFVQEGRLKAHNCIDGKFVDSLLHACFA